MTRKNAARKKFAGALAEPIVADTDTGPLLALLLRRLGKTPEEQERIQAEFDAENRAGIDDEMQRKLSLLAEHYVVPAGHEHFWRMLCMGLILDFVPGFQTVYESPKGRGRPQSRCGDSELVRAVETMRYNNSNISILRACALLSKREGAWKDKKPKTLDRRYREEKSHLDRIRQLLTAFEIQASRG